MKPDSLNEKLINAIKEKVPQRAVLTNRLTDILGIEKEAIYRRLRGEVAFSFAEVAIIKNHLGISLDELIGSVNNKVKPFHLRLADLIHPTKDDYELAEYMTNYSNSMESFANTEYGAAMNMIPITLSVKYKHIFHFYVYKWWYQNCTSQTKRFSEVVPDPGIVERLKEFPRISGLAERIVYIWEESIFQNVVKDVSYFNAINLISNEEKEAIKDELFELLDELEQLAVRGKNDAGNKVYIYVSNISFETSYSYVQTPNFCLTMIMTFTLNMVGSIEKDTFERIKQFMQSLKRTSTLISESGEMYRIQFFEKQRDIVSKL